MFPQFPHPDSSVPTDKNFAIRIDDDGEGMLNDAIQKMLKQFSDTDASHREGKVMASV